MDDWKYFTIVLAMLFAGWGLGFCAGISAPINSGVDWETLLTGLVTLIGGALAYVGATIPYREARKAKMLQFQIDMKKSGEKLWSVLNLPAHEFDSGYGIWDFEGHGFEDEDLSPMSQVRRMVQEFSNEMPRIPPDLMNRELFEICKGIEEGLFCVVMGDFETTDDALKFLFDRMVLFDRYVQSNT